MPKGSMLEGTELSEATKIECLKLAADLFKRYRSHPQPIESDTALEEQLWKETKIIHETAEHLASLFYDADKD